MDFPQVDTSNSMLNTYMNLVGAIFTVQLGGATGAAL